MTQALPLLALLLLLTGCGTDDRAAKPAQPVSAGHEIFLQNCAMCHQGAGNPPGPNAVVSNSSKLASEAQFRAFLRNPSPGMPPFPEHVLPDKQVATLYEYLTSANSAKN